MTDALKVELEVLIQSGFRGGGVQPGAHPSALTGRREGVARVTHAALKLLRWLSGFGLPTVVVIDDWWRATEEARGLVAALAVEDVDLAFKLLLLERIVDGTEPEGAADRTRVVHLGPLSPEDGLLFKRRCLDGDAQGDAVARWFGEDCPRMPFDIAQTARALKESAALKETDGAWVIDDARAAALGHPSLTLGIGRRIGELSSDARALATAALALDERMLRARVGELITAGLVARSAAAISGSITTGCARKFFGRPRRTLDGSRARWPSASPGRRRRTPPPPRPRSTCDAPQG